jgi:hypothetical protein
MATNFGKTHYKMIEIPPVLMFKASEDDPDVVMFPARTVGQQVTEDGTPWKDVAKEQQGTWFIAVESDGQIICAERDPTMCAVTGVDIWQIGHPGPAEAIRGRYWDGKEVSDAGPA